MTYECLRKELIPHSGLPLVMGPLGVIGEGTEGPQQGYVFTVNIMLTLNMTSEIKVKVSSFSASELQLQS